MRLNLFSSKVLYYFPCDLVKKPCLHLSLSCLNLILYQLLHTFALVRWITTLKPMSVTHCRRQRHDVVLSALSVRRSAPDRWSDQLRPNPHWDQPHRLVSNTYMLRLSRMLLKEKKKRTLIGTYWKISARKKKKNSNISPIVVSRWSQRSTRNELRHRRTLHRWYVRPTITQSYWFEVIYFLALTSSKRIRTKNTARHIYYTNDKSKDWCLRLYWRTSF